MLLLQLQLAQFLGVRSSVPQYNIKLLVDIFKTYHDLICESLNNSLAVGISGGKNDIIKIEEASKFEIGMFLLFQLDLNICGKQQESVRSILIESCINSILPSNDKRFADLVYHRLKIYGGIVNEIKKSSEKMWGDYFQRCNNWLIDAMMYSGNDYKEMTTETMPLVIIGLSKRYELIVALSSIESTFFVMFENILNHIFEGNDNFTLLSEKELIKRIAIGGAEQGGAEAQGLLGIMHHEGQGVPQDYKEAVKWYTKAAEQGLANAQSNLGLMYDKGDGVPQDYKEAIKWYTKAAEQGLAEAQCNLGGMYSEGKGVPQDYKEAVKWYKKAAEQGFAGAQVALGERYAYGQGVPQDYKEAIKLYTKAAEQGLAGAQCNLGLMFINGEGIPQDYKEAVKWWTKAAEQGDAKSQFNLGLMYYKGEGIPQDYKEAVKWYTKAAEQGYDNAQYNLGLMYYKGEGVPQDYKEAVKWFTKAAELGYALAQYNLGVMFHKGEGVPEDYVRAYKWFILAAAQGDIRAAEMRDLLKQEMTFSQDDN